MGVATTAGVYRYHNSRPYEMRDGFEELGEA